MKKLMCIVLALALASVLAAYAEPMEPDQAVIDRFEDVWVDGDVAVEIWFDDGWFHCSAVRSGEGDDSDAWTYETCAYDAEQDALVCEGGERYYDHFEGDELVSELVGEGLTATFAFNDEGSLIWYDSEGLFENLALQRLSEAEEEEYWEAANVFLGRWQCDRCTIEISPEEDDVKVLVYWGNSASSTTEWVYTCIFDEYENTLTSVGEATMTEIVTDEDGEQQSAEALYTDGAAVFSLDDSGCLVWDDLKAAAGEGMAFERLEALDADPAARFEGRWAAGRATIEIWPEDDAYRVSVLWGNSAADSIAWDYTCLYDEEIDALVSVGGATKADVFFGEDGEIASSELMYDDGAAVFMFDEQGKLLWNDAVEDAAADLAFEFVMPLD